MATKTYRLSPKAPELTFSSPLPGVLEPGQEFELDGDVEVRNVDIEVKRGGRWVSTYEEQPKAPETEEAVSADVPADSTVEPNGGDE